MKFAVDRKRRQVWLQGRARVLCPSSALVAAPPPDAAAAACCCCYSNIGDYAVAMACLTPSGGCQEEDRRGLVILKAVYGRLPPLPGSSAGMPRN